MDRSSTKMPLTHSKSQMANKTKYTHTYEWTPPNVEISAPLNMTLRLTRNACRNQIARTVLQLHWTTVQNLDCGK